jgi:hypothetical protein
VFPSFGLALAHAYDTYILIEDTAEMELATSLFVTLIVVTSCSPLRYFVFVGSRIVLDYFIELSGRIL